MKDYKSRASWVAVQPWYVLHKVSLLGAGLLALVCILLFALGTDGPSRPQLTESSQLILPVPSQQTTATPDSGLLTNQTIATDTTPKIVIPVTPTIPWQTMTISRGENLSIVFDRLGLSPTVLYRIMALGEDTEILKKLIPGDKLDFHINGGKLLALRYEPTITTSLEITGYGEGFKSNIIITELERKSREVKAVINDSLFLAGLDAGLSDNIIMRLVGLFGWDIDFALNIRKGDNFKLIYQEQFKDGDKVGEGPILAAEFVNRGKTYQAVRYTAEDGQIGYYNENGYSMRKAFLRTPVKFSRISSRFSLGRKHPVLNRIRAHRGVDYAAPTGTPIKATGKGRINYVGTNGGYGRMITIRHGGNYTTAYAHMSRYARGMKRGKHVNQDDIIGYVGRSGLATGPHLHYEFRVNGVHRNPLTIKLPKSLRIPKKQMDHFKRQTDPVLAQLHTPPKTDFASQEGTSDHKLILALEESEQSKQSLR